MASAAEGAAAAGRAGAGVATASASAVAAGRAGAGVATASASAAAAGRAGAGVATASGGAAAAGPAVAVVATASAGGGAAAADRAAAGVATATRHAQERAAMFAAFTRAHDVMSAAGRHLTRAERQTVACSLEEALLLCNVLAKRAHSQGSALYYIIPKHHALTHIAYDNCGVNPWIASCYGD